MFCECISVNAVIMSFLNELPHFNTAALRIVSTFCKEYNHIESILQQGNNMLLDHVNKRDRVTI